ncbi:hypothetical protein C0992_011727 [Termitomyces sp. T32_za158]|nr:hypothetical protein C0992_011727 [Termitomyces sp. T32_za158]
MDESASERHIFDWDESDVHNWLSSLGYPQYESQIRGLVAIPSLQHNISGDVLCLLDPEGLKGVGIATIGQRLAILKAVYLLKIAHGVPIDSDHYVPPSEVSERAEGNLTVENLYTMVTDQAQRIHTLEEDNRTLNSTLQSLTDEFNTLRTSVSRNEESTTLRRQPSFKWAQFVKPQTSPTKLDQAFDSPHPSPRQLEHDVPPLGRNGVNPGLPQSGPQASTHSSTSRPPPVSITDTSGDNSSAMPQTPKPHRQESSENLNKSFKVTLDDPTWKVLPAALKKYRINNDNWQNYAMFICYGSPSNRIDRCLSYDEKPLLLFQKLKDAKKNPVFMLKHIKDIRSPIAVAQQKHAARKASSVISADTTTTAATQGHDKTSSISRTNRPPRLEVQELSAPAPLGSSASLGSSSSTQPGWPEPSVTSPANDTITKGDDMFSLGSANPTRSSTASTSTVATTATNMSGATVIASTNDVFSLGPASAARSSTASTSTVATTATNMSGTTITHDHETKPKTPDTMESLPSTSVSTKDIPVFTNAISYAVAIYPYMAEQDDEFDVVVGDTFVILSRSRGWWVVQRDPTGSGLVEPDKQGWVPAGCLLETNVPVASAIAEATATKSGSTADGGASKTPILPLSIISTSFPGIALMDYTKKGDEELDLVKDDALRVFKRYNHWSYAVKEDGGDRGWVPSWFIGKVGQPGAVPVTPNGSTPSHLHSSSEDAMQPQVSPMSSAFPTSHARLTVPLS